MQGQVNIFSYYIRTHEFLFRKLPPPRRAITALQTIAEIQEDSSSPQTTTSLQPARPNQQTEEQRQQQKCYKKYLQYFTGAFSLAFQSNKVQSSSTAKQKIEAIISHVKGMNKKGKPMLPPQTVSKKTLVLELDETLISTTFQKPSSYDYKTQFMMHGRMINCYSTKRFGLESFLYEMSKLYELVIFTSTHTEFGKQIVQKIDPQGRISYLLNREHCIRTKANPFTKSIKGLGRNDNNVIIVDSNQCTEAQNPHNCYKIEPFLGKEGDKQLLRLQEFLRFAHRRERIAPIANLRQEFQGIVINKAIDYVDSKFQRISSSTQSSRLTLQRKSSMNEQSFSGEFDLYGGATANNLVRTW